MAVIKEECSLSGEFESLDEVSKLDDWNLEKAFNEWRHTLRTEKLPEFNQEASRVKERVSNRMSVSYPSERGSFESNLEDNLIVLI